MLASRNDLDGLKSLAISNGSTWACKEMAMYKELQQEKWAGAKKMCLLADPSNVGGDESDAGILYSWERKFGSVCLVQVFIILYQGLRKTP